MRSAWASRWAGLLSYLCGKQAPRFDRASVPAERGRAVVQAIYVEGFDNLEMNVRHHENQLEGYRQESLRRRWTAAELAVVSVGALPGWQAWMCRRHRGWLADAWRVQLSGRHASVLMLSNRLGAWRVCACGLLVDAPDRATEAESRENNDDILPDTGDDDTRPLGDPWSIVSAFLAERFSRIEGWGYVERSDEERAAIRASFRAAPGHRVIGGTRTSGDLAISVFSYLVPASQGSRSRSERTSRIRVHDTPKHGA